MTELLQFSVSPLELIVRGSAMYWFLFLVFRFIMRRDVGAVGIADVLLLVLIADAAQNAMAGGYTSITEGFVLVSTLLGWNYALDRLAYYSPAVRKFTEPKPLLLVEGGRVLARNLRREFITRDDLDAQLRQNGVSSLEDVKAAYLESDGKFSVVLRTPRQSPTPAREDGVPGAG
ncbi:MAG: YetF domain-containing protein [Burkholderiaceae bacterium]